MIGVVGTSRGGLVENRTAKERVAEALSLALSQIQIQAADVPITIVSGGGLVPNYAFDWARKNGHKRLQVVSAAVKSTPKGVERLEIGTSFGDESEQFVGMCQHFVRVGGGPQSHREVQLFRERNPTGVVVEVEIPLRSETAPPLICIEPLKGGVQESHVLVTSFAAAAMTLTLQWGGAGSRDRTDKHTVAPGASFSVQVSGWLGRDADFISVTEIRAEAGGEAEEWRADQIGDDVRSDCRLTYTRVAPISRCPAAAAARVAVTRECRQRRGEEAQEAARAEAAARALAQEERSQALWAARAARHEALEAALAPYRRLAANAGGDDDERWEQLRGVPPPEMVGEWVEDGLHGMPQSTSYSDAWLAPTADGGVVCVYKVTTAIHDKYGSDMCPSDAVRWEARPVLVSAGEGEKRTTSWRGPATVLHDKPFYGEARLRPGGLAGAAAARRPPTLSIPLPWTCLG